MPLFEQLISDIKQHLTPLRQTDALKQCSAKALQPWKQKKSIVLLEDTAFELGHPERGSLSLLLFSETTDDAQDELLLFGPDVTESSESTLPFGQVIMARGTFANPYESFLALEDQLFGTNLEGMMIRSLPSQQSFWCRLSQKALTQGFSIFHWGLALSENLKSLEDVQGVTVLLTTSADLLKRLQPIAHQAQRIIGALVKRHQETLSECATCEFADICEEQNHAST
jgi:CO dehydrogenase/acetyl-CoA synthase beta subunit